MLHDLLSWHDSDDKFFTEILEVSSQHAGFDSISLLFSTLSGV